MPERGRGLQEGENLLKVAVGKGLAALGETLLHAGVAKDATDEVSGKRA